MATFLPRSPGLPGEDDEGSPLLGALSWLGRTLDTPARWIREGITGQTDASGRDVLEKWGILDRNQPGLDLGDVGGFFAELAMDPLTYVGGLGALTKGGKLAKRTTDVGGRLAAAKGAGRIGRVAELENVQKSLIEKLAGRPAQLAPTMAEQGKLGQRAALSVAGMPIQIPGVLPALDKTKGLLGKVPGADLLGRLFNPSYGKSAALKPFTEELEFGIRQGGQQAVEQTAPIRELLDPIAREGNLDQSGFIKAIESRGKMDQTVPFGSVPEAQAGEIMRKGFERAGAEELGAWARTQDSFIGGEGSPIEYFPRYLSPEARKLAPGGDIPGPANPMMASLRSQYGADHAMRSAHRGNEIARDESLRGMFTPDASSTLAAQRGLKPGEEWFDLDAARAFTKRVSESKTMVETAKFARSVMDNFATNGPGEPIHQFAAAMGLHIPEGEAAKYAGLSIPKGVAAEAIQTAVKITQPEELTRLAQVYDKLTGWSKWGVTIPWIGYHIRNIMSDSTLSFIRGGAEISELPKAAKLMADPEWLREGERLGIFRGKSDEILKDLGVGEVPTKMQKAAKATDKYYTGVAERFTRSWHYLSMRKQGLTDMEAAARVRKDLLDYSDLTTFEKEKMRRVFFFYSWPRKVIPLLVDSYLTSTGKMAGVTRATTMPSSERPKEGLPEFLRQTSAIPAGPNAQGDPTFIANIGSPLEEINKLDLTSPEGGFFGMLKTAARKGGAQLNPILKYPLELASGQQFFFDRPVIQSDKAPSILAKIPGLREAFGVEEVKDTAGKSRYRGDPFKLHALANSPFSRLVGTASDVANAVADTDKRKSGWQSTLQMLTGVRTPSLDSMDRARTAEDTIKRQMVGLERAGLAGRLSQPFLNERGKADADAVAKWKRLKAVRKLLDRLREEQKQAPP